MKVVLPFWVGSAVTMVVVSAQQQAVGAPYSTTSMSVRELQAFHSVSNACKADVEYFCSAGFPSSFSLFGGGDVGDAIVTTSPFGSSGPIMLRVIDLGSLSSSQDDDEEEETTSSSINRLMTTTTSSSSGSSATFTTSSVSSVEDELQEISRFIDTFFSHAVSDPTSLFSSFFEDVVLSSSSSSQPFVLVLDNTGDDSESRRSSSEDVDDQEQEEQNSVSQSSSMSASKSHSEDHEESVVVDVEKQQRSGVSTVTLHKDNDPVERLIQHIASQTHPSIFDDVSRMMQQHGHDILTHHLEHQFQPIQLNNGEQEHIAVRTARRLTEVTPEELVDRQRRVQESQPSFLPFGCQNSCLQRAYRQLFVSNECGYRILQLETVRALQTIEHADYHQQQELVRAHAFVFYGLVIATIFIIMIRSFGRLLQFHSHRMKHEQRHLKHIRILRAIYSRPAIQKALENELDEPLGRVPPVPTFVLRRMMMRENGEQDNGPHIHHARRLLKRIVWTCVLLSIVFWGSLLSDSSPVVALQLLIVVISVVFVKVALSCCCCGKDGPSHFDDEDNEELREQLMMCTCCCCGATSTMSAKDLTDDMKCCGCCMGTGVCKPSCADCCGGGSNVTTNQLTICTCCCCGATSAMKSDELTDKMKCCGCCMGTGVCKPSCADCCGGGGDDKKTMDCCGCCGGTGCCCCGEGCCCSKKKKCCNDDDKMKCCDKGCCACCGGTGCCCCTGNLNCCKGCCCACCASPSSKNICIYEGIPVQIV